MVTAELKKLDRLVRALGRMADPKWWDGLSRVLGEAAYEEVMRSFDEQRDPWGRPWKRSLRAELEGGETLSDTGRLRRSIAYRVTADGFAIGSNVLYAGVHQFGAVIKPKHRRNKKGEPYLRFRIGGRKKGRWVTKKTPVRIPARPFIAYPELSPRWERALDEALGRYLLDGL